MSEEIKDSQLEAEEEQQESKPKKKKTFIIIGGIMLLVLLIQTAIIIFMYFGSVDSSDKNEENATAEKQEEKEEVPTAKYLLDSFMVNLRATGTADNYLRTTIYLEYELNDDEQLDVLLEEKKVDIQNEIIKHIRTKTLSDVRSIDSIEVLGEEVQGIVNELLKSESIVKVHFSEFLYN